MPPLADAVSLIDGEERDFYLAEEEGYFLDEFLGRHIDDFQVARHALSPDDGLVDRVAAAVESLGRYSVGFQGLHLVVHQTNQRGNHDGGSWQRQRRNLVANALAATRRHQYETILALHDFPYDLLLVLAEGVIAKIVF